MYHLNWTKNYSPDAPLLTFFLIHKVASCKENGLHTHTTTK